MLSADFEWLLTEARRRVKARGFRPPRPQPEPTWPCRMRVTCPSGTNGKVLRVRCECQSGTVGPPSVNFHGWDSLGDAADKDGAMRLWRDHRGAS